MRSITISEPAATSSRFVIVYIPFETETPYGCPRGLSREQLLVATVSADESPLVPAGMKELCKFFIGRSKKEVSRERTPFDDPPGYGFVPLSRAGVYVADKPYSVQSFMLRSDEVFRFNTTYQSVYPARLTLSNYEPQHWEALFGSEVFDAREEAVRNLYGSLHRRQDMALGVFLAEFRESLGLLGKSMLTIARVIKALKKGRVSDALSALGDHYGGGVKTRKRVLNRDRLNRQRSRKGLSSVSSSEYAANMWLELNFGWIPIIEDIYNIIDIINGSLNSEGDGILSFSGYGELEVPAATCNVQISARKETVFGSSEHFQASFSGKLGLRYTSHATYRVNTDVISVLAQLGLTNPLEVAWELVPYSFVIDWFLPIGDWISSLSADAGLELIQYTESCKLTMDGSVAGDLLDPDGSNPPLVTSYDVPFKLRQFRRSLTGDSEIPPMPLPQLNFQELLQPWKIVTSLALLR